MRIIDFRTLSYAASLVLFGVGGACAQDSKPAAVSEPAPVSQPAPVPKAAAVPRPAAVSESALQSKLGISLPSSLKPSIQKNTPDKRQIVSNYEEVSQAIADVLKRFPREKIANQITAE